MSGVCNEDGLQTERCNQCGKHVDIRDLLYAPSPKHPEQQNVDLCTKCYRDNNEDKFTKRK